MKLWEKWKAKADSLEQQLLAKEEECQQLNEKVASLSQTVPKVRLTAYQWKLVLDEFEHGMRFVNRNRKQLEELWSVIATQLNNVDID